MTVTVPAQWTDIGRNFIDPGLASSLEKPIKREDNVCFTAFDGTCGSDTYVTIANSMNINAFVNCRLVSVGSISVKTRILKTELSGSVEVLMDFMKDNLVAAADSDAPQAENITPYPWGEETGDGD
jgi:hypothetical protein